MDVDVESLYEAVAIAVAQFREDDVSPSSPGPLTEFTVAVVPQSRGAQDTPEPGHEMGGAYDRCGAARSGARAAS